MKRYFLCLLFVLLSVCGVSCGSSAPVDVRMGSETDILQPPVCEVIPLNLTAEIPESQIAIAEAASEPLATEEEIELIALLAMAEAEGECELGRRLVIDVVLNRVDDPHFPDTISEVVWQKNQFSGMYGERIERCYVMEELVQLVREELENRTDSDVIFFRTEHYSSYGVPMFQVEHHYFSSYD